MKTSLSLVYDGFAWGASSRIEPTIAETSVYASRPICMKAALLLSLALAASFAGAQSAPASPPKVRRAPIRLQIRHADPWFVKGMLEGQLLTQPEYSTMPSFQGFVNQATNALFADGKFIVNPIDNSLWFFPNP